MDSLRKLWILVVGVFLFVHFNAGQPEVDSMNVCRFCDMDELHNCNTSDMIHFNRKISCEDKMCTLGIDQSFDNCDNVTIDHINLEQICVFKDATEDNSTLSTSDPSIPLTTETSEAFEKLTAVTVGTFMDSTTAQAVLDCLDDQPITVGRSLQPDRVPAVEEKPPPLPAKTTCFVGNSATDETCSSSAEKLKTVDCSKADGCMSIYSDGNLIRGCARPQDIEPCQKPENTTCLWCSDERCNKIPWNQCYHCNSKENPNCSQWSEMEMIPTVICPNYNDNCSISITPDGHTARECSQADLKPNEGVPSHVCVEPLCNGEVFPKDRRQCIQCDECEAAVDPSLARPCARYDPQDQCFLYVTAKSKMIRGCVSDTNEMLECKMNEPKCITCGDANGCNSVPLMKEPMLSCSKCKSTDNASCAWAQSPTTVTKCKNKLLYYLQESCMTLFDVVTQEAVRDCSYDYGACTDADKNCRTCSGDGCNRGNLKVQKCVQCCSTEQSTCSCRAEGIPSTKCPQEMQSYESKGCYTMTKANVTTRGCISSLKEDTLKFCKTQGNSSCILCEQDGCNNQVAPSSGWVIASLPLFVSITAVLHTI